MLEATPQDLASLDQTKQNFNASKDNSLFSSRWQTWDQLHSTWAWTLQDIAKLHTTARPNVLPGGRNLEYGGSDLHLPCLDRLGLEGS